MLVGPQRSGKGTIARVIRRLVGDRNVCGPTLANMSEQFGLSILIGMSVAIIADARISGRTDTAIITERLLSISGEDTMTVPRKFLPDWNGKLPTHVVPRLAFEKWKEKNLTGNIQDDSDTNGVYAWRGQHA